MRRYLPFLIIGLVFLIAAGGGLLLFRSKNSTTPLKLVEGKPGAERPHIRGSEKAQLTLEEFGDYQCVPCSFLAATLLKVEHDYATSVRLVYRQFPIKKHAHAFTAACAAEAAGLQGRFWEMHDLLFLNSKQWGKEVTRPLLRLGPDEPDVSPEQAAAEVRGIFVGYATSLGLDIERFQKDMDSEEIKARINADRERGASVGVNQTPTLFINGIQVPYTSLDAADLRKLIDAELGGKAPVSDSPAPTPASP